ncbi:MAG: DJ-1/PfpI family protein [Planctomycetaceae bacterium]|nr:DJ-1/PfpI family protein [Planctomycetaceae bacterium]
MGFRLCFVLSVLFSVPALAADAPWQNLISEFDANQQTVAGTWQLSKSELKAEAAAGARIALPFQPTTEYDFRISFTRNSGAHSVAMMFVVGQGQATFEVDAWGQHLSGIQMISGQPIRDNSTRKDNQAFENGRRYTMLVEVRKEGVKAYLDDQLLAEHKTDGSDLTTHEIWRMPDATSLGIGVHSSETTFHTVEVRPVSSTKLTAKATPAPALPGSASNSNPPAPSMRNQPGTQPRGSGKRVLLVIANQHFFYREYYDPLQALKQAGIQVDVAAGTKTICRPHQGSGEQGSGEVMPDLAITQAKASDYDAIMFSGGWGSSMYQYAFRGSYANRTYQGDPQIQAAVNRLLTEFIKQDKYVGALCHGVSVLAWARVDGKSILNGRRAVGSPRQSPGGRYPGLNSVPLSRWNAEVNGAILTPIRSIGDPRTSADDVLVDGKIITGEDDNSALLFGQTLARLLNGN